MSTSAGILRPATATQRSGFVPLLAVRPAAGIILGLVIGISSGRVAAGLCVALGAVPAAVATQTAVAYIVFGRFPLPLSSAAHNALLLAAGGLIQLVLSTAKGRGRFRAERTSTGAAFGALADLAIAVDVPGVSLPAGKAHDEAVSTLDRSWAARDSTAHEAFRGLRLEAVRLRVGLMALSGARTRLADFGATDLVAVVDTFRRWASDVLPEVAAAISAGTTVQSAAVDVPTDLTSMAAMSTRLGGSHTDGWLQLQVRSEPRHAWRRRTIVATAGVGRHRRENYGRRSGCCAQTST
ncbi:MAG: hypothetical protein ABI382_09665 [Nakamurella sp.]